MRRTGWWRWRRRRGNGSSTAQGARHEDRCSEVIILLSFTTAKLGLTLTDVPGPLKWHGHAAAETQTPKCQAVLLRLVCLLISFPSPLAVTSLSYARPHERVPVHGAVRSHVSTVTAEWIQGRGHHAEKNSVCVRAPSRVSYCSLPIFFFFFLNFIVVTACQSCFVWIFFFFVTFDTLWTVFSLGPVTVHQLRCENDIPQSFLLLLLQLLTFVSENAMIEQHAHILAATFKKISDLMAHF